MGTLPRRVISGGSLKVEKPDSPKRFGHAQWPPKSTLTSAPPPSRPDPRRTARSLPFGLSGFSTAGYPLDSGSHNPLWFPLRLHPVDRMNDLVISRGSDCHSLLNEAVEEFAAAL